jgi:choline dehydrogenase-like flavoprotein
VKDAIDEALGHGARARLQALFDTLIPADETPGAWEGGARFYLERELNRDLAWAREPLRALVAALDEIAVERYGSAFAHLNLSARTALVAHHMDEEQELSAAVRVAMEGYYAAPSPNLHDNWGSLGFTPDIDHPAVTGAEVPAPISPDRMRHAYDTVVIGAGAGGGVLACALAEAGQRVLLVERSRWVDDADLRGDHLHGKRLGIYDINVGPGVGHPRVVCDNSCAEVTVEASSDAQRWGLNAMCLGGGTRVWQGMAWRFLPEDFEMATLYGVPSESTLADWPIDYDAMERYYDRAEWEIGVCGDDGLTARTPRTRGYPMPALPDDLVRRALGDWAKHLGWRTGAIPFAINSVPWGGRPACVACGQCMGHTCPVGAKNGSLNLIARAVRSGNCDLLMSAQALKIYDRGAVRPASVDLGIDDALGQTRRTVTANEIVVCAGAIETPRLLRASQLGNDQVGRHLHSHTIHLQLGETREPIGGFRGPGHSIATLDFVHADKAPYGGGVLFDAPSLLPLAAAQTAALFKRPSWGRDHKAWMRSDISRIVGVMAIGQDVPHADSEVSVSRSVSDRWGMPVARVRMVRHAASDVVLRFVGARCTDWLRAGGCALGPVVLSTTDRAEHVAGTCRMGLDPQSSACSPTGRVRNTRAIRVCDASLHPSNGSVNPGLTVMANAFRVADAMLGITTH